MGRTRHVARSGETNDREQTITVPRETLVGRAWNPISSCSFIFQFRQHRPLPYFALMTLEDIARVALFPFRLFFPFIFWYILDMGQVGFWESFIVSTRQHYYIPCILVSFLRPNRNEGTQNISRLKQTLHKLLLLFTTMRGPGFGSELDGWMGRRISKGLWGRFYLYFLSSLESAFSPRFSHLMYFFLLI